MDIINFPALIAKQEILTAETITLDTDLIVVGQKVNNLRNGTQYKEMAMKVSELLALVQANLPAVPKVYAVVLRDGEGDPIVDRVINNDFTAPVTIVKLDAGKYAVQCPQFTNLKTTVQLQLRNEAMSDGIIPYTESVFEENTGIFWTFIGDPVDGFLNGAQLIVTTYQ